MNNAYRPDMTDGTAAWRVVAGGAILGTMGMCLVEAGASASTAAWFRCAFGLMALTVWAWAFHPTPLWRLPPGMRTRVGLAAGLVVLSWVLFFAAIQRLSVGLATVVFHVQPLCVVLAGAWFLGDILTRDRVLAVCVAMLGLSLATGILDTEHTVSLTGVAMCLGAAACQTAVVLLLRARKPVPPLALAWWQCAVGVLVLWPWVGMQGWPAWGAAWGWLATLGVVHTGLAYVLIYGGMARLATGRMATLQFVYPAVTLLVDAVVYGHRLNWLQSVGVALMALALWGSARPVPIRQTPVTHPES